MPYDHIDRTQLIAYYEQRLAADPSSRVFAALADLLRQEGRLERARAVLESGLARNPDFVCALVVQAQILVAQDGAAGAAADVVARVLARDADNLVALRLAVETCETRGDWVAAVTHLERLARLEPTDGGLQARLRTARTRAVEPVATTAAVEPVAATTALTSAAGGEVDGGVVTVTLADLYLRQGHREKAREILTRMASSYPQRADIAERLARLEAVVEPSPAAAAQAAGTGAPDEGRRRTSVERGADRERFGAWAQRAHRDDT